MAAVIIALVAGVFTGALVVWLVTRGQGQGNPAVMQSQGEIKARLDRGEKFVLVDVREDNEWAKDHLPGAVHLGKGVIERDVEKQIPDTATPLVLYCGGGFRSALAADNLQKMGYRNVLSMDGGIRGWRENGFRLIKD